MPRPVKHQAGKCPGNPMYPVLPSVSCRNMSQQPHPASPVPVLAIAPPGNGFWARDVVSAAGRGISSALRRWTNSAVRSEDQAQGRWASGPTGPGNAPLPREGMSSGTQIAKPRVQQIVSSQIARENRETHMEVSPGYGFGQSTSMKTSRMLHPREESDSPALRGIKIADAACWRSQPSARRRNQAQEGALQ